MVAQDLNEYDKRAREALALYDVNSRFEAPALAPIWGTERAAPALPVSCAGQTHYLSSNTDLPPWRWLHLGHRGRDNDWHTRIDLVASVKQVGKYPIDLWALEGGRQ